MTTDAIAKIRTLFEEELTQNASLYHPIDIDRVRTEEWQVKRFLIDQPDQDIPKAFQALTKSLQWKKSYGIHDRTDSYFPKEFWELNGVEVNGENKQGCLVQWEWLRNQRVFSELGLLPKQFVAHNLERVDRLAGERGFILLTNCNGAGMSNMDLDLAKFKIAAIDLYPCGLKAMYFVDLPWLLNAPTKIVIALMSDKLRSIVSYIKGPELFNLIDAKYIPVELKGERDKSNFPQDLVPLDQLAEKLGLSDKFLDIFYKCYKIPRTNKA